MRELPFGNDRKRMRSMMKLSQKRIFEVYFALSARNTSDDRRSNLAVVRRKDAKYDAAIRQKKRKKGV